MNSPIDLKVGFLAVGVVVGLGAVAAAIVNGQSWSVEIGILGVVVAIRSGIELAKRLGATEQPQ